MSLDKVITDAGRAESGFAHEEKDCTVRALATAGNLTYRQAHAIMAAAGRRTGYGSSVLSGIDNASLKGLLDYKTIQLPKHERVFNGAPGYWNGYGRPILVHRWVGPTIKQFIEQHPRGRYVLRIKKHAFAVIDGVMFDKFKQHGGAEVQSAWEIIL